MQEAENGVLSRFALSAISESYGMKETLLMAMIKRIPALRYEDVPHKLEICATCKCSGDLRSYIETSLKANKHYATEQRTGDLSYYTRKCMKNTAHVGKFSSDRTIQEYVDDIWHLEKVKN